MTDTDAELPVSDGMGGPGRKAPFRQSQIGSGDSRREIPLRLPLADASSRREMDPMRGYSSYEAGGTRGTCLVIGWKRAGWEAGSGRPVGGSGADRSRRFGASRFLHPAAGSPGPSPGFLSGGGGRREKSRCPWPKRSGACNQVIWTAGISPLRPGRPEEIERVEVEGVRHLIEACKRESVAYITYLSCMYASQDARSALFRAKWRAEDAVRESGVSHSILRSSVIIHPGRRFYLQFRPSTGGKRHRGFRTRFLRSGPARSPSTTWPPA